MVDIGQTFGKLTVIRKAQPIVYRTKKRTAWECRCECGRIRIAAQSELKRGRITSCNWRILKGSIKSTRGEYPLDRLKKRIENYSIPEPNSGCWLWEGSVESSGYGQMGVGRNNLQMAHRVSYLVHVGPVPEGKVLDHICRNPSCINPDHLEAVTHVENMRRGKNGVLRNSWHPTSVRKKDATA